MTDKQIIIDGVDVSGCTYSKIGIDKKYYCEQDLYDDGAPVFTCDECTNCYYKQLKRKEQECKALREEKVYTDMAYEYFKTQFQSKEQECEALQMSDNEAREIVAELEAECEELKKEKRVFYNFLTNKYNYGSFRPMWGAYLLRRFFKEDLGDFFDEKSYKMADTIEEKEKQIDKYFQTLTEIKEIAEYEFKELMNAENYHNMTEVLKQILQKISEVLND